MNNDPSVTPNNTNALTQHFAAVQHFLKTRLKDGQQVFKDQIAGFRLNRIDAGEYINLSVLPINNALKDIAQIEKDFQQDRSKNTPHPGFSLIQPVGSGEYCICLNGQNVPVDQVLAMKMEENY